ncbi:hypothetical protein G7085_07520 [Tessaracoccus sp. HDW20]|uniref:hypothetical protein n=1 Tax=Tessaracoccus coleopterorum TaxID=2714950 RepID=UPI0018D3980A|nr:hypothetical protein [Tessaracoccus coleopterorum]NHB84501.1 hypothetical protein [Tessaracoccus coleopterorum]
MRISGNHLHDLSALATVPTGNITATGQVLTAPTAQATVATDARGSPTGTGRPTSRRLRPGSR